MSSAIERQTVSPPSATHGEHDLDFLAGGGEMGALIRALDWSQTPVGPVGGWSSTLRTTVRFLLANRFPLLLWWGPEYVQIYNDPYRPIPGTKHPQSLGQPARECWPEIWQILQPLIDTPFLGGPATWMEDIFLEPNRRGFLEETHFTIAYSPVPDDTAPGGIGGVLATVHEITAKVVGERRVRILSELGARAPEARTAEDACLAAAETLAGHPNDIPFALLYLIDSDRQHARLAGSAGVSGGEASSPAVIDLNQEPGWPIASVVHNNSLTVVEDLAHRFAQVPSGPWSDPPHTAVLVPIRSADLQTPAGVLVAGVSSRLQLDQLYRSFYELVATQIATAVANARAYEEERRRAEALAQIDRAKTAFFSNVSHEFRTPLTLMLGPLEEAIADARLPQDARERLQLAQRNATRLHKLVNGLLDFSRIEAGRAQASYEETDLAALTRDLASTFRSAMEKAGLTFSVDCEEFNERVYVDREMWEKIVLNLLSNAFKFTLAGGVTVRLKRANAHALLEVSDTGVGVPEQELPRLFERFHRVEVTRGRTHEGSGIGLALVYELVKLHGGAIEATSAFGQGTTFGVLVPFGAAHLPPDRVQAPRAQSATAIGARAFVDEALRWLPDASDSEASSPPALVENALSGRDRRFAGTFGSRILLADDNADMRDYVRDLLSPYYAVESATDGEQALAAARRARPDLILSDIMMPRLDGFALLAAVRADETLRGVPVVLVSARAGEEARIEGLDAGADDYIIKPFSARELLARVGALLELRHMRRAADEALRLRTAQLEAADQQKDEFLAMLAHELRNPLAPIRNAGEVLSRIGPPRGHARTAVDIVLRQVGNLTRLVDDLLDVSRITQGRIELKRRPIQLADVISQALEIVEPLIREKQQRVLITSNRVLRINGDPARLVQCVANVLTNASKYTDTNGEISLTSKAEGSQAVLTVSDSGIGIAADLLPHVFDLFVQGNRTLDRAQGGLGIGLAVVKRLVEMHGGSVSASSAGRRRGATFEIRLPLTDHDDEPSIAQQHCRTPRCRILVVDDNEDAATSLAMILALEGHEVEAVHTSRDALERAVLFKPDVAVLDIGLPGMNGYELARRLRENPALEGIRLVALTGYGQAEDKERARAAGFDDHLIKPADSRALEQMLGAGAVKS